jgi:hypothetical protein
VTDRHIRILRLVAQHRKRELDEHDAADGAGETASAGRRWHLEMAAERTLGRVTQAEARRRNAPRDRIF